MLIDATHKNKIKLQKKKSRRENEPETIIYHTYTQTDSPNS